MFTRHVLTRDDLYKGRQLPDMYTASTDESRDAHLFQFVFETCMTVTVEWHGIHKHLYNRIDQDCLVIFKKDDLVLFDVENSSGFANSTNLWSK